MERKKSQYEDRIILGLHEYVTFLIGNKKYTFLAKIDTGAARSSVDYDIAETLGLGPEVKKVKVKSALGVQKRKVIKAKIKIKNTVVDTTFSISYRSHLKRKILIGVNTLRKIKELIDPLKDVKE